MKTSIRILLSERRNGFLVAVLGLTLVQGVLYAVLNPPFASPDELDHFRYVAYLATGGAAGPNGHEHGQPPTYYALMAPAYWLAAGQPTAIQLLSVRLSSVPFLLGLVLVTWFAARSFAPNRSSVPIVATLFVALNPQLAYISASVNNDGLSNLVAAILVYLTILMFSPGSGPRPALLLLTALMLGIGLMTKGQILPVAASCLIVMIGRMAFSRKPREMIRYLFYFGCAAALIALAFQTRSGSTMLARATSKLEVLGRPTDIWGAARDVGLEPLHYQFVSFWSAFLGESLQLPTAFYLASGLAAAAAATGYIVAFARGIDAAPSAWLRRVVLRIVLVGTIVGVCLVPYLYYFTVHFDTTEAWRFQAFQGRYLFVAIVPIALLVAEGSSLLSRDREAIVPALLFAAVLGALNIASLYSMSSYYAWPAGR